jgi:hypothetical protein
MNKEQIFRKMYDSNVKRDAYIASIPPDISAAFFDNTYVNELSMQVDWLCLALFGDSIDSVYWFLYEWKPGYECGIGDKELCKIENIDDMINWMKANEGF